MIQGRVDLEDFLARHGADSAVAPGHLMEALRKPVGDGWDWVCAFAALAEHYGTSRVLAVPLGDLLLARWHEAHEEAAHALQNIRSPETIDALLKGAFTSEALNPANSDALAVKCIWALHDIGTPEAAVAMGRIAAEDRREDIRGRAARKRDELLARPVSGDAAPYRQIRDGKLGPF
jgi:hypothetical protein